MRGFSGPRWGVLQPLAGAALAIGLVFVVVGALPIGSLTAGAAPEAAPDAAAQVTGGLASSSTPLPAGQAQPTRALIEDSNASPQAPAASGAAPEFNAAPSEAPAKGVDVVPTVPTDMSVQQPTADQSAPPAWQAPATPLSAQASPPGGANVAQLPAPTSAPGPVAGQASVPTAAQSSLDHLSLTVVGLLIALLALLILGVVTVARRRYADPLIR